MADTGDFGFLLNGRLNRNRRCAMCKKCIVENCESEALSNRRYCRFHYLERKRIRQKERYDSGEYKRTTYPKVCVICGKHYSTTKKTSLYCSQECLHKSIIPAGKNNYVYNKNYKHERWEHRAIAKKILGRPLNTNEVVHHIDFNPKNNSLDNLLVISRTKHNALHRFLNMQGDLLKRLSNVNIENCWNNWLSEMTTTWLETTNVKVIKLSQYSQSAAEPRSEEGSETMYDAPLEGGDIVQTTTQKVVTVM